MTLPGAVLYSAAAASGIAAVCTGRLTAWPLLASLGLCWWLQMPFEFVRYVRFDLMVIYGIVILGMFRPLERQDYIVLALFPVAWTLYLLPDPWRFWGCWAVVVSQFLVTLPWASIWSRALRTMPHNPWDIFDLRVRGIVGE